jgi:nitrogen fixation NifU-like protein
MSDIRDLYQEMILEHNKSPRNFQKLEKANRTAEGYNPLCGDRLTLYLQVENNVIKDIGFQGSGCAISKASASMMTASVKGKTCKEIEALFEKFHQMLSGDQASLNLNELGKLAVFSGVSEYPARVKCATLAWHTLRAGLNGTGETVSTEKEENDSMS